MSAIAPDDRDPFTDPASEDSSERSLVANSTLIVSRDASLTLGTDALVVLDEQFDKAHGPNCCGLLPSTTKSTRAIPLFNILWATVSEFDISIDYAHPSSKSIVRRSVISYTIDKSDQTKVSKWVEQLLDRAYGASQKRKRIKVLINPFGGKGNAQKWWHRDIEPIFAAARCDVNVEKTQYTGHAVEIGEKLDISSFDVVAACSGDGVPHEVFNGFGRRKDARKALTKIALAQLPCGSGNAMSCNLNGTDSPSLAALCIVKGLRMPLDLISLTQGPKRTLSFLSQSVGWIADSDLGTDHLRWMGNQRFTYGILTRLVNKTVYPCDIALAVEVESKADVKAAYVRELSNKEPAESRREARPSSSQSTEPNAADGLPPLRFGSVTDPLPENWSLKPHPAMGTFYIGNMSEVATDTNFFPAALPNDGRADMVYMDGDMPRLQGLKIMTAVESGGHFAMNQVRYHKIVGYRFVPRKTSAGAENGYVSIDGESFPMEPFQAEVHRGLGTVLCKNGHIFQAKGVQDVELS